MGSINRRTAFQATLGISERCYLKKISTKKRAGHVAQVVECLASAGLEFKLQN
jgi:hypothetical protein